MNRNPKTHYTVIRDSVPSPSGDSRWERFMLYAATSEAQAKRDAAYGRRQDPECSVAVREVDEFYDFVIEHSGFSPASFTGSCVNDEILEYLNEEFMPIILIESFPEVAAERAPE